MTDEQKRALEVLENVCTDDCVNKAFVVEPIKQLIQTQQEEIERYKIQLAEVFANTVNSNLELKHKYEEDLEALNLGWKTELEKKDTIINTMQAEFERLENLEDNTDMLKEELKKKNKIIHNSINEIEKIRQYFSEDVQVEFIRILEILKDKKVIDW